MKTVRRLTVEIERRRVEWSVSRSESTHNATSENPVEACPHCGSPWTLLNHAALPGRQRALPDLLALLASLDLHVRSTPSHQIWICRNSFEQLKENI